MPFDAVSQANHNQQDDIMDEHDESKVYPIDQAKSNTGRKKGNGKTRQKENRTTAEETDSEEKQKKPKVPAGVMAKRLSDFIDGYSLPYTKEIFPHKFVVYWPNPLAERKILQLIKDENGRYTAKGSSLKAVQRHLTLITSRFLECKAQVYNLGKWQLSQIVGFWEDITKHIDKPPKAIGFLSEPKVVFTRLPFDPIRVTKDELAQDCPVFYGFIQRITSNQDAFCARIGSIFDPTFNHKQVIWLSGPTGAGKSALFKWLDELVGGLSETLPKNPEEDRFWKLRFVGKILCFGHEANAKFIGTEAFKDWTGLDRQLIEGKGENGYTQEVKCLTFFDTNNDPIVPDEDPIKERIINCRIEKVIGKRRPIGDVIADLHSEAAKILGYCIDLYETKRTEDKSIPCDYTHLDAAVDEYEAFYRDICEGHFRLDSGGEVKRSYIQNIATHQAKIRKKNYAAFIEFIIKYFNKQLKERDPDRFMKSPIRKGRLSDTSRTYVIFGIAVKPYSI